MTEYHDGMRIEKEKNSAVQRTETAHRPQLAHNARVSLLARFAKYCDPRNLEWDWDDVHDKFERHAINAVVDLEAALAILREALKEADEALDSGERFLDSRCGECSEGSRPFVYQDRPCWVHKARKLIGDAQ